MTEEINRIMLEAKGRPSDVEKDAAREFAAWIKEQRERSVAPKSIQKKTDAIPCNETTVLNCGNTSTANKRKGSRKKKA